MTEPVDGSAVTEPTVRDSPMSAAEDIGAGDGATPRVDAGSSSDPHSSPEVDSAADGTAEGADPATDDATVAPSLPLTMTLEAVLMVADEPVSVVTLAELAAAPVAEVEEALRELATGYDSDGRGFDLREVAGGWRFYTRAECAPIVERYVLRGQSARLTQAALETLAVVAYRQPVSRGRVAAVRGVNVDGVMRTLQGRGLIAEQGNDPETSAALYVTTDLFLERLGLRSLTELPDLAPFLPEIEALELDSDSTSS